MAEQCDRREEVRRLRRWLAFSERLDRLIDGAEMPAASDAGDPALSARHPERHLSDSLLEISRTCGNAHVESLD